MRIIERLSFDKDGILINPDEKVFFVSRSGGSIFTRFGTYLGLDQYKDPVVSFLTQRWWYKSKHDYGYKPMVVITSLPRRRIWSKNHFEVD